MPKSRSRKGTVSDLIPTRTKEGSSGSSGDLEAREKTLKTYQQQLNKNYGAGLDALTAAKTSGQIKAVQTIRDAHDRLQDKDVDRALDLTFSPKKAKSRKKAKSPKKAKPTKWRF